MISTLGLHNLDEFMYLLKRLSVKSDLKNKRCFFIN